MEREKEKKTVGWREKTREVIFETDTPASRLFDLVLIICILLSVFVVMADSVASLQKSMGKGLVFLEWFFTILFTVEYVLRLICYERPTRYAFSFFGMVDLLAVLPTYVSLLVPGSRYFLAIRSLRLLRIFRVLKLARYMHEMTHLGRALRASQRKILVFFFVVLTGVVILGSAMYVIEGEENGFTSIPRSIYWAIVTLTTVGYGDISPSTPGGQALASLVMLLGYAIIAVPTGIVTVEMSRINDPEPDTRSCPECSARGHEPDARYCMKCGHPI